MDIINTLRRIRCHGITMDTIIIHISIRINHYNTHCERHHITLSMYSPRIDRGYTLIYKSLRSDRRFKQYQ